MNTLHFIIPVYNVEKYLSRCLESVINQSYQNTNIILVDDGSPDRCPEICDDFSNKYENITVIHKSNGGLSDARNAGLLYLKDRAEESDYITFVDSDDFLHPLYGEKMVELCEKYDCGISQCEYEKGSKDAFEKKSDDGQEFFVSSSDALLGYKLKSQSTPKVYRAKLFKELLFPVGVINEDEFVTYKAVYAAKKIAFTNSPLYYYFQHDASIMDNVAKKLKNNPHRYDFLKAYEERIQFFKEKNETDQVKKTNEKICTDIILRYCEQMYLSREDRDEDCVSGKYMEIYRTNYKKMIDRKGMPIKRKLMYICFNICPYSAVFMGRIFTLRK